LRNIYLFILLILSNSLSLAAGFDCDLSDDLTPIEEIICSDPQLNEADEKMSQAYFILLRKLMDRDTKKLLIKDQREWLAKRNTELSTCSQPNCEIQFYNLRVNLLDPLADIDCKVFEDVANEQVIEKTNSKSVDINCQKSATEIICTNRLLRHMDGKVIELYTPFKKELNKDHTAWLTLRDEKIKSCDFACIWQFYKERIEFLIHYSFDESYDESYIEILEK